MAHDIIDNRNEKLVDHINRILSSTEAARFAVGYFFLSGFESIADRLNSTKELRQQLYIVDQEGDLITRDIPRILGTVKAGPEIPASTLPEKYNSAVMKIKRQFADTPPFCWTQLATVDFCHENVTKVGLSGEK